MNIQLLFPLASLISLSMFLTNCANEQQKQTYERIERLENGAVARRVQIVNGKKEGKMTDYYPDGKLRGERLFQNDKQVGRTVLYHPGGQVMEVQYYVDGLKEGGDTIWYENGQVQFSSWFKNGKKNGYLRKWSPEGKVVFEARYEMDSVVEIKGERIRPTASPAGDSSATQ
ncbi:MAG: hypothetical protein OHK0019_06500 [Saprospiraceae bacterium]